MKKKIYEKFCGSLKERKLFLEKVYFIFKNLKKTFFSSKLKFFSIEVSIKKGTFLKNSDVDVFMILKKNEDLKKFIKDLENNLILKKINYFKDYSEHPYLRLKIENIFFDLVPCYEFNEKKKSIADRSPLHSSFILKNFSKKDILETVILKIFFKCFYLYNSKNIFGGFNGYLCEIFILKYSTFENFLNKFISLEWKDFIYLDPVDNSRIVSSSILKKIFLKLKFIVLRFSSKEILNFLFSEKKFKNFFLKPLKKKILKEYFFFYFKPKKSIGSFVSSKNHRIELKIQKNFNLLRFIFDYDSFCYFGIRLKEKKKLKKYIFEGPEKNIFLKKFLKKGNFFISNEKINKFKDKIFLKIKKEIFLIFKQNFNLLEKELISISFKDISKKLKNKIKFEENLYLI